MDLAGNYGMIETRDGPVVAVRHLQRGTVQVQTPVTFGGHLPRNGEIIQAG